MTRRNPIYIGNDNLFVVRGLRNRATGDYVNDGTAELTLLDADGNEISGQTWPLSLTYIAGSNGDYQGTIEDDIDVEDGEEGTAVVDLTGDSLTATLELPVIFGERGEPALNWTSRTEMELLFGPENIRQWADLNNENDAEHIADRIDWAAENATAEARELLNDSPVDLDNLTEAPLTLRMNVSRMGGVLLYESRGVKDTDSEEGNHKLLYHKKEAAKYFQKVRAGSIRIGRSATMVPGVIPYTSADGTDDDADELEESSTTIWV